MDERNIITILLRNCEVLGSNIGRKPAVVMDLLRGYVVFCSTRQMLVQYFRNITTVSHHALSSCISTRIRCFEANPFPDSEV